LLSKIPIQKLLTPADVSSLVDNAVINVFAVLIKHNLLTNIAVKLLENKNNANVSLPDGIVRVCGELHKNCVHGYCKNIKHYTVPSSKNYKKKTEPEEKKKRSSKCGGGSCCNGKSTRFS